MKLCAGTVLYRCHIIKLTPIKIASFFNVFTLYSFLLWF